MATFTLPHRFCAVLSIVSLVLVFTCLTPENAFAQAGSNIPNITNTGNVANGTDLLNLIRSPGGLRLVPRGITSDYVVDGNRTSVFRAVLPAATHGSIFVADNTKLTFQNINSAGLYGGAFWLSGNNIEFNLIATEGSRIIFENNTASYGGAINNYWNSRVKIIGADFTGNNATVWGGAIQNYRSGHIEIEDATFTNNTAATYGGAINFGAEGPGGSLMLADVTFTRNRAIYGGAIQNFQNAPMTLERVHFENNVATGAAGRGGAIHNRYGALELTDVTFSGNTASFGNAIYNETGKITLNLVEKDTIFNTGDIYFGISVGLTKREFIANVDPGRTLEMGTNAIGRGTGAWDIGLEKEGEGTWLFAGDNALSRTSIDIKEGNVTFAGTGTSDFANGIKIESKGTLQLGNGNISGPLFRLDSNITNNSGTLILNRSDDFTLVGTAASGATIAGISGDGIVRQEGLGTVTLGDQTGHRLQQDRGTINLTGNWIGDFEQRTDAPTRTGGTLTGNGTITGNAKISGTIAPVSTWSSGALANTLTITGDAIFNNNATLAINLHTPSTPPHPFLDLGTSDQLVVGGEVTFGNDMFNVDIGKWENGRFAIIIAGTMNHDFIKDFNYTITLYGNTLGSRQWAELEEENDTLFLTTVQTADNRDIFWTGNHSAVWDTATGYTITEGHNWINKMGFGIEPEDAFNSLDFVTFNVLDSASKPENRDIWIDSTNVEVTGMAITGGDYTFSGGGIIGVKMEEPSWDNRTTNSGALDITGAGTRATFNNALDFENGVKIGVGATIILGNDVSGNAGSFASGMTIDNAGTLEFDRSDDFTFSNTLTGTTGTVLQSGSGTVTLTGVADAAGTVGRQEGTLKQAAGTINLTGTWNGKFEQTSGTLTGNGTITGNAEIGGIIAPVSTWSGGTLTRTLTIEGEADLTGATLSINLGPTFVPSPGISSSDRIVVTNTGTDVVTLTSTTKIDLGNWETGRFAIITSNGTIAGANTIPKNNVTLGGNPLGSRQDVTPSYSTPNALILEMTNLGNRDLVWRGNSDSAWNMRYDASYDNWESTAGSVTERDWFNTDDYVIFNNTSSQERRNVEVVNGAGVRVSGMRIDGGNYTFSGGRIYGHGAVPPPVSGTTHTIDGELNVTGGRATFLNAIDFVNGVNIASGATVELGDGGSFSDTTMIANAGTLWFDREAIYTLTNIITGTGNVIKTNIGTLILDADEMGGNFTQLEGTVVLIAKQMFDAQDIFIGFDGRTWTGDYTQDDGTFFSGNNTTITGKYMQNGGTFFAGNGTTIEKDAEFSGTTYFDQELLSHGTLTIEGNARFDGATLGMKLNADGESSDLIDVKGAVTHGDSTTIGLMFWEVGTFTLMTADGGGIIPGSFTIDRSSYGSRQVTDLSKSTERELILTTISEENRNLVWTGGASGNWNTIAVNNWKNSLSDHEPEDMFNPNDFVTFDSTGQNQGNVQITNGSAQVSGMRITGGNYTFSGGTIHGIEPPATGQTVTGKLEVTGNNTTATFNNAVNFINGVDIESGAAVRLGNGGSITGNTSVKNAGTLGINGSGPRTIGGDLTMQNNSTLEVSVNRATGEHSTLVVSGDITIVNGAKLDIYVADRTGTRNEFRIIEAEESQFVNGRNALFSLTGTWEDNFDHGIDEHGYWVFWTARTPDFAKTICRYGTPNAIRAAKGMDRINELGLTGNISELYNALAWMPNDDPQGLADAFAQLHGEVFAASRMTLANMQRSFQRRLPSAWDRLTVPRYDGVYRGFVPYASIPRVSLYRPTTWGAFTGDYRERENIGRYSRYELRTVGVIAGMDTTVSRNMFVGVAFGYDNAYQNFKTIRSNNQIDVFRTALYGGWHSGETYIDGYIGYTKNWNKTRRDINIPGFSGIARSQFNDDMFSTGFEIGRKLPFVGRSHLTPSIGLHYIHLATPRVMESGAGVADLLAHSHHYNSLRLPVGAKLSRNFYDGGLVWTPEVRAFYIREMADASVRTGTSFAAVSGVPFYAESGKWGRDSGRLGAGLNVQLSNWLNFRVDYDYEVYNHTASQELGATLGVRW